MSRLKAETRTLHEAAEVAMSARSQVQTREGYTRMLLVLDSALAPVAAAIEAHPAFTRVPDHAVRTLRPTLLSDLDRLGLQFAAVAEHVAAVNTAIASSTDADCTDADCTDADRTDANCADAVALPADCEAAMLGMLYVVEGSSLGGVHLSRMVRERLAPVPTAYFDRYGDQVGPLWQRLGQHINTTLQSDDEIDQAVAAASGVFQRVIDRGVRLTGVSLRQADAVPLRKPVN